MNLTIEQIRAIFDAGREQGENEATSADWNCAPRQSSQEAFVDAIREVLDKAGVEDAWCFSAEEVIQQITKV